MAKKRKRTVRRSRDLRGNTSVETAERNIARTMGLPEGCIKLVLPNGRKARSDSSIASLRAKFT